MSNHEERLDLMPGSEVTVDGRPGQITERLTTRNGNGPHREITVEHPDRTVSVLVNGERDAVKVRRTR